MSKILKKGDKVRVKSIKKDKTYGGILLNDKMAEFRNKIITVSDVWESSLGTENFHAVEDLGKWIWSSAMVEKIESATTNSNNTEVNVNMQEVVKAIEDLTKNINKRTMYDDIIQEQIIEKAKEVPLEDLESKVIENLEKFIQQKYGSLPIKIEITDNFKKKEMSGIFHNKFDEILKIIHKGVPLMLTGPAGAGKNHTLEQVAEALDLDFYFTNAVTQEFKLTGFIDASGTYQETQFYKAYKNGGLFFLDEVDASVPEALINLKSAIANGYYDFPVGRVNANENFRIVCAGNTYGTGADMVYVGRNCLDGATLDRFAVIEFNYDEQVEKKLAYDEELYNFIINLRNTIKESSLRYIVSMRATINATKLLEIGMSKASILRSAIIKNMQIDDLNVIIKKLEEKNNNEWVKELRGIINDRI